MPANAAAGTECKPNTLEFIQKINPVFGEGTAFKLPGSLLDVKLLMDADVNLLVARIRFKIKALLRTRSCYDMNDMLGQFKTHIWGLIEYQDGAMIRASESTLDKIERLQRSFVSELRILEEMAFLDFNFGPL